MLESLKINGTAHTSGSDFTFAANATVEAVFTQAAACEPSSPPPGVTPTITTGYSNAHLCRGGGSRFGVEGTGFNPLVNCITYGPNVAAVNSGGSATFVVVSIPADATPGTSPVTIDNGTATGTSSTQLEILAQKTPVIVSFSVTSGPSGTIVTATGTDLNLVTGFAMSAGGGPPLDPPITNQTATSFQFVMTGPPGLYKLEQMFTMICGTQFFFGMGLSFTIT